MSEQLISTPGTFGENGNFLLERELGTGGMGGVYMGRDKMLDRPVAVKVMLKEYGSDAEFVEKFKKEAQSAARLIHPNIAQIYSYGICDGMPYIAMELAAGGSLYSIMNANPGKVDVARVIKICQQVAQALQCASDQGFVHGDVKPENILLDANGNAKLVDFGLAAMQKDTDEIWGTPYYISPEKVRKEPVDFRSDMYSLGGTLYHALTGVAPFEGDDSIAVIRKRFDEEPKKPSEIRPDLTPAIDNLVMTMLAMDREERYPSFEALLAAFNEVLTSGLSMRTASLAPQGHTTTSANRPAAVRGGRRMKVVRGGVSAARRRQLNEAAERAAESAEEEEEEGGGSLGAKVVGIVIGIILLIGAIGGGLTWYVIHDRNSRAASDQAQINHEYDRARSAVTETLDAARAFADKFDKFAEQAITECRKPSDALKAVLPADQAAVLDPGMTDELRAAIASTNAASAEADSPAAATTAAAKTADKVAEAKTVAANMPKFREPTEDEKDPASPEGQKYLEDRKAFYAEQAKKPRDKKDDSAEAAPAEDAPKDVNAQMSDAVIDMNKLWERAYGCRACAIRVRHSVNELLKLGNELNKYSEKTLDNAKAIGALSQTVAEKFEQIKSAKDVETVSKAIPLIKSKGKSLVDKVVNDIRVKKLEAKRQQQKEQADQAEKERKEKLEQERKERIEKETTDAKAKFAAIVEQGCFRQLDWKSALRMLNGLKAEQTTAEGQLAADLEIRKVNDMKMVQDLFIKNLPAHEFKGKLGGCKVEKVNEKEISLFKPGSQFKLKISWQKFYKEYPGNLNEIINAYVVNARLPSAKTKLTQLEWANAMTGAALTMQLVCSDVKGAIERSEELIKTTVKRFPEYVKTARDIFPDMTFDDVAADDEED